MPDVTSPLPAATQGQQDAVTGVAAEGRPNPLLTGQRSKFWHACEDDELLLRLLTSAGCPIVCKGYRIDDQPDWHAECEARGRQAFQILRGWAVVDLEGNPE